MCSCAAPAQTQSPYRSLPSISQSEYALPWPKRDGTLGSEIPVANSENLKSVGFGAAGFLPSLSSGMVLPFLRIGETSRGRTTRRDRPRGRQQNRATFVRHTGPF